MLSVTLNCTTTKLDTELYLGLQVKFQKKYQDIPYFKQNSFSEAINNYIKNNFYFFKRSGRYYAFSAKTTNTNVTNETKNQVTQFVAAIIQHRQDITKNITKFTKINLFSDAAEDYNIWFGFEKVESVPKHVNKTKKDDSTLDQFAKMIKWNTFRQIIDSDQATIKIVPQNSSNDTNITFVNNEDSIRHIVMRYYIFNDLNNSDSVQLLINNENYAEAKLAVMLLQDENIKSFLSKSEEINIRETYSELVSEMSDMYSSSDLLLFQGRIMLLFLYQQPQISSGTVLNILQNVMFFGIDINLFRTGLLNMSDNQFTSFADLWEIYLLCFLFPLRSTSLKNVLAFGIRFNIVSFVLLIYSYVVTRSSNVLIKAAMYILSSILNLQLRFWRLLLLITIDVVYLNISLSLFIRAVGFGTELKQKMLSKNSN